MLRGGIHGLNKNDIGTTEGSCKGKGNEGRQYTEKAGTDGTHSGNPFSGTGESAGDGEKTGQGEGAGRRKNAGTGKSTGTGKACPGKV